MLYSLYAWQQTIELSTSALEVKQALAEMLQSLFGSAEITIDLTTTQAVPGLPPLSHKALLTQEPQMDEAGRSIVVPFIRDNHCYGFVKVEREQGLSNLE